MAQIRDTIELLTTVLRENGASKFKAEVFRQAKFNSVEAVRPMWKLLFELLYYCTYDKIDDVAISAARELTTEEMVVFVKRELQQRGFHSKRFATLPYDMSEGSRELLLAFGWLLCRESMLEKFMNQCSSPIEEGTAELFIGKSKTSTFQPLSGTHSSSAVGKVQQLLVLNGKLRMNLRSLFALQCQKYRKMHKIHEATKGVCMSSDRDHLSAMEVQLLRNPELLKKVLYLLEKDNTRLQNLLQWQEQEEIFWKWMETVLDLKVKSVGDDSLEEQKVSPHSVYNIPPDGVTQMREARKELQSTILKFETMVEELERLWEVKKSAISERELDSLIASLDLEISLQKTKLSLTSPAAPPTTCTQLSRSLDLSYVTALPKKTSNLGRYQHENRHDLLLQQMDGKSQDILTKISNLEDHMNRLENCIASHQSQGKARLEKIASTLPDLICIPPLGHREYV